MHDPEPASANVLPLQALQIAAVASGTEPAGHTSSLPREKMDPVGIGRQAMLSSVYCNAGQEEQVAVPARAEMVLPVHPLQRVLSALLVVPAGQAESLPLAKMNPARMGAQLIWSDVYLPVGQAVHDPDPAVAAMVFPVQATHAVRSALLVVPAAHSVWIPF